MNSTAIYRLPHSCQCTIVRQRAGEPEQLPRYDALNGRSGFVLASFHIAEESPLLLIHPDQVQTMPIEQTDSLDHLFPPPTESLPDRPSHHPTTDRQQYSDDYYRFHTQLEDGRFEKLVLARRQRVESRHTCRPLQLFQQACQLYPRLFIALVSTPRSGTWLAATPEILLEGTDGGQWRTIALAGTMRLTGSDLLFDTPEGTGHANLRWGTKDIKEQRYVGSYIAQQLKPFVGNLHEEGPRTARAANLVHLRSDFTFTLLNNARAGYLLQALHPTPAVCGLPKDDALRFILRHEPAPRRYYSGFMGPLQLSSATHLYVTLRCMQVFADGFHLYAGSGLLPDSNEEQEWQETEAKMATMRQCLPT